MNQNVQLPLSIDLRRFIIALKNSPVIVGQVDRNLCCQWIHYTDTSYSPEFVLGKRLDNLVSDGQTQLIAQLIERVLSEGISIQEEIVFHLRRERRVLELRIDPQRGSSNEILGVTLAAVDITRKKQAERNSLPTERRFELLAGTIPEVIFIVDNELNRDYFNRRFFEWTGISTEAAQGKGWWQAIHPADVERVRQYWHQAAKKSEVLEIEYRIRRVSGAYRWCISRAYPYYGDNGGITRWYGTITDIDDLKRAEKKYQRLLETAANKNRQVQEVLAQLPVGVIIAHAPSGRIIYVNRRGQEIHGFRMPRIRSFEEYNRWELYRMNGQRYKTTETPIARALLRNEVVRGEWIKVKRKDGSWLYLNVNTSPIHNQHNQVVAVIAAFDDITERVLVEQDRDRSAKKLRQLNEKLQDRVAEQTAVLRDKVEQTQALAAQLTLAEQSERGRIAQILHDDLQQYLFGLRMHIRALETEYPETTSQTRQIQEILDGAIKVMRTLTDELSPPLLHSEGLSAALRWLAGQVKVLHGLHLVLDLTDSPDGVSNEVRILVFRLIRELLLNVVKHAGVKEAAVSLQRTKQELVIIVEDRGVGFDPDAIERPDVRGGLGLFTARERLALFKGKLTIDSSPGAGTRAVVTVPLAQ